MSRAGGGRSSSTAAGTSIVLPEPGGAVTTTAPAISTPPHCPAPADDLRQLLKRCSPSTYAAALQFRQTRDPAHLPAIIYGIIERFVERPLRPQLQAPAESVRLATDLGLDSLTLTELVILAEETLQLSLQPDELPRLRTLADLQQFITAKLPK
jgi:3-hydroxyacyl-[acyl-carrier-protein] dehydratase